MNEPTNIEAIRAALEPIGFKYQPSSVADNAKGFFYRRVETKRPCLCNNKDQILINAYEPGGHLTEWAFEVEITGEFTAGLWAKLKAYSIMGLPELLEKLPRIERSLVAAWEAMGVE
jgi:hypothetical protein